MSRPFFSPRGTGGRFIDVAVIFPAKNSTRITSEKSRGVTDTIEMHRYAAACLVMLNGYARLVRGLKEVSAAAFETLPTLTPAALARFVENMERLQASLLALPDGERMPTLLAVTYALHESSPMTQAWRDIALAIETAQAHEKVVLTAEHEERAAVLVKGMMAS